MIEDVFRGIDCEKEAHANGGIVARGPGPDDAAMRMVQGVAAAAAVLFAGVVARGQVMSGAEGVAGGGEGGGARGSRGGADRERGEGAGQLRGGVDAGGGGGRGRAGGGADRAGGAEEEQPGGAGGGGGTGAAGKRVSAVSRG